MLSYRLLHFIKNTGLLHVAMFFMKQALHIEKCRKNYAPPLPIVVKEHSMQYKPGETKEDLQIDTVDENKNAALSLVKQARYSVDIFTQDLDAELYNNEEFEQSIFKLARRHPNTRIRILLQETKKAAQNAHCLITLAQNLTSSVFIHQPSAEYKNERCAFMVVDKLGLLHRVSAINRNYKASVNFMSPRHARILSDFFNLVWEHSTPDIQTRRIYL